ncbi:MAG: adventurous gliding motility lipoprotein CglB [Archangium sp.]|nr:adventurous gliding motility lipoprotein CglB [Archangium sp.]
MRSLLFVSALSCALLTSCSGLTTVCVAGKSVAACPGPDGCAGRQTCNGLGTGYGACECANLKPNVMLLVDVSGSMLQPTNPAGAACPAGCGTSSNPCPATCPTRISELKSAMATFLQASGAVARLGVTVFPTDTLCRPAIDVDVTFPPATSTDEGSEAALTATAQQVNARIQALTPLGGTPTAASLAFLGSYAGLVDANDFRDDVVVLVTDGLPNCDDANANQLCSCSNTCSAAQITSCSCTTSTCTNTLCAKGCLDRDGAVLQVKNLRAKGIRTVVVGFGADLASGEGTALLDAMAREGGFTRHCPTGADAECGGNAGSCDTLTKLCAASFFQAANATELAAALRSATQR